MSERRLPPALVALSPGDLAGEGVQAEERRTEFLRALARAHAAGLRALILRESALSDRVLLDMAERARGILTDEGWLCIHDRAHLVAASRADALHLGFRSLSPGMARTIVDRSVAIGFSAHADDDRAHWRESDYIVFGPVLDTPSKRGLKSPVGFDGLKQAVAESSVPVWALGGLKPEHAARVRASGASGVAVLSGIFGADDPAGAVRAYRRALDA